MCVCSGETAVHRSEVVENISRTFCASEPVFFLFAAAHRNFYNVFVQLCIVFIRLSKTSLPFIIGIDCNRLNRNFP